SALNNHTNNITDKNTCVRVIYSNEVKHIDLPIYYKTNSKAEYYDEIPCLAHKGSGWIESDPYKFVQWFSGKAKNQDQLKRIVRYLKAWCDNKQPPKMPSGLVMTILASNHYLSKERDDEALIETLKAIRKDIDPNYGGVYRCYRPTPKTTEDLLEKYPQETFLKHLSALIESGDQALYAERANDACKKWQLHLGNRFVCSSIEENMLGNAKSFEKSDVMYANAKSAQ
ncbi:MAG TPA: CBASS cGAMP synthase, partial [Cytophagaceae bacterium]